MTNPKNDGWDAWRIAKAQAKRLRKAYARLARKDND